MSAPASDIDDAARRLQQAERSRIQIRQLSLEFPDLAIEDAYRIQKGWMALKVAEGRTVKGHKIGLTSKAMQSAVGIGEPDYGVLLDDMFFPDGAVVPTERYLQLRIEAELAFVLAKPLAGPEVAAEVRRLAARFDEIAVPENVKVEG